MKRLLLAAGLAGLAVFPAGALAHTPRSKVLSVDARHHTVELVDAAHAVHAYRFRGTLPRLSLGDSVSYRRSGHTISHVKKTARAFGTISFYAKVVRSGSKQVRLRLGDGSALRLSSKQVSTQPVAHAAAVSHGAGHDPGAGPGAGRDACSSQRRWTPKGHWTITLTLPSSSSTGGGATSGSGRRLRGRLGR